MSTNHLVEDIYNPLTDHDEAYERQQRPNNCLCDTDQRHPTMSETVADCPLHGWQ